MTAPTSAALTGLILLAVCHAHPQYPVVYYSSGQPYGGGYYNPQQAGPGRGNSVQRYAGPHPLQPQPQPPGQYVYVAPAGYPGIPPQQAPILFRQEAPVNEAPEAPPPTQPGVWTMFIQWIGIRPSEAPPPVVAPAEETPETMPAAAAEDTTPPPSGQKTPEKPEKVMQALNENETANLESLDEPIPEDGGESPGAEDYAAEDDDDPKSSDREAVEAPTYAAAGGPMAAYPNRRYVPLQPPQFYGNFDVLQHGHLPLGPVQDARESNFVYLRNQPHPQYPQLQYPYQPQPFPVVPPLSRNQVAPEAYRPGVAALAFQKTLQAAKREHLESRGGGADVEGRGAFIPGSQHVDISQLVQKQLPHQGQVDRHEAAQFPGETELLGGQPGVTSGKDVQAFNRDGAGSQPGLINVGPGYQNLYFFSTRGAEENQEVAVEAPKLKKEAIVSDAENVTAVVEEQQAGPSVAQAKPQAIAVAGPGGVAAAQPIATAIVGPGGLAVAAPTATAVAGQTGGGALIAPAMAAVNKQRMVGKLAKEDDEYSQSVVAYGG